MSAREGARTHDPITDLLTRIKTLEEQVGALSQTIELLNVHPLRLVVTELSAGPPPVYQVALMNPVSGVSIVIAASL